MKRLALWTLLLTFAVSFPIRAATYVAQSIQGVVEVRHGVEENWAPLKEGDLLKPEDSIRTGQASSAVILMDGRRKIHVPSMAIVEVLDLRPLDQQDFLLRLTMEFIREIPPDGRDGGLETPSTTILHGPDLSKPNALPVETESGVMSMRGTRVLYDNAFYATCVLRAKEIFRIYPDLANKFANRMLVAISLEEVGLHREALNEYRAMSDDSLSPQERAEVEKSIARLKEIVK